MVAPVALPELVYSGWYCPVLERVVETSTNPYSLKLDLGDF